MGEWGIHMDLSALFEPFMLGPLALPNRVVMAPMTRQHSPDGIPGADVAAYYARRAAGGTGLILTEGTTIDDPAASVSADIPRFADDSAAGWRGVCDAVHAAGARIMPQLWHLGIVRRAETAPNPQSPSISPSGLIATGAQVGEPMTHSRIEAVIGAFAEAARLAHALGFDGVELHGAHGYLIDQFFWAQTNRRTDEWGGDIVRRTRFAAEITRAVRAATAPDFPIVLRWSQWKSEDYSARLAADPHELEQFLAPMVDAGVDIFHCSTRRFWQPEFPEAGSDLNLAGWTRKVTGRPTITVGSVGLSREDNMRERDRVVEISADHLGHLAAGLRDGDYELVAVGRAILANPDWANLVREGRLSALRPFSGAVLATL
jgi:2,4-dienoyl-CoA reductase-like NADH-dependent reductase (Old Yellow Enzyme family)